jgi:hypothetical protein
MRPAEGIGHRLQKHAKRHHAAHADAAHDDADGNNHPAVKQSHLDVPMVLGRDLTQ